MGLLFVLLMQKIILEHEALTRRAIKESHLKMKIGSQQQNMPPRAQRPEAQQQTCGPLLLKLNLSNKA